ncbi:protein-glucosylgalactosylhydroxylysine glucosidase-like [Dendronephthya gigantea]|uniref:protein-glucosylgalactosylhydroxylysine glucosidase-like n=1 Tax=Dendronephthya gigantea TaxID=151771 RepID=UPI0010699A90|nr:protein-glucosylgalactosylhydroxylysine glucosidase-like [Dendronephthya gigantea]
MPTLTATLALVKSLAFVATTFTLYWSVFRIYDLPKQNFYDGKNNMSSSVFTSDTLPSDERLMATIGNGFLATRIFSDTIFVSGVYNGRRRQPSHRARIPSTVDIRMSLENGVVATNTTYSLDVERAVFTHRVDGNDFVVEELIYAHRKLENLIVVEIRVKNSQEKALNIGLSTSRGNTSDDLHFTDLPRAKFPPGSTDLRANYGMINTTEEADSRRVDVAVVWSKVPESLVVEAKSNRTFYFVTAIVTTLNTVTYLDTAFDCHKQALILAKEGGLLDGHTKEWAGLWQQSGIDVLGDLKLAQAIQGSLYYILSSIRSSWPYGLSPGSLSSNDYWGHSFWDTETWMYPSLLMLYPEIARSLLLYRFQRMDAARVNAKNHNVSGTMFPWESAFTGCPVCPEEVYSNYEIHVNGDIGFAVEQFWMVTQDQEWLNEVGIPLISGIAEFWASRVTYDDVANDYVINAVMCPDEYHSNVNNSAFTNAVAKRNLEFASKIVPSAPAKWLDIAQRLRIPFDDALRYHPEYDGYNLNVTVKQADVILLGYPLMFNMSEEVRKNDLVIYEPRTDPDGPAMTKAMFTIGWLELGKDRNASTSFRESYQNVREPFKVWTEYPSGDGAVNFITGMGGFLQAVIFGYGGLRIHPDEIRLNPKLPENVTELPVRGLHYRGNVFDLRIGPSQTRVGVRYADIEARPLLLQVVKSRKQFNLNVGENITFQNSEVIIREHDQNTKMA